MTRAWPLALALGLALAASVSALGQGPPVNRVEQGGAFFIEHGCYGCHIVGKMGTPIGPDLSRIGARHSLEYLERWLRDPLFQRPTAHMPRLELSEDEVRALAAYLVSLR